MEKNQEWTEPTELKAGDRVRVVELSGIDAFQEAVPELGGVGYEFTFGKIHTYKGHGWCSCEGLEEYPNEYYKVRLAIVGMSDVEALRILDAWTAADPEGRTWTMRPYVAGFVACQLLDDREQSHGNRGAWEFGNVNALPGKAFSDARRLAAEAIKAGLPTIRDERR